MGRLWLVIRVISCTAFVGFAAAGFIVAYMPQLLIGGAVPPSLLLLQGLSVAFLATISAISLMVALDPANNWRMLLPLAVGKVASSLFSLGYYLGSYVPILLTTFITDCSIAVVSLVLYLIARASMVEARGVLT
jgi:hypothetical protein